MTGSSLILVLLLLGAATAPPPVAPPAPPATPEPPQIGPPNNTGPLIPAVPSGPVSPTAPGAATLGGTAPASDSGAQPAENKNAAPEQPGPASNEKRKPSKTKLTGEEKVDIEAIPAAHRSKKKKKSKPQPGESGSSPSHDLSGNLPSLTPNALRAELHQTPSSDHPTPQTERARLEQLAKEITQAREALRLETAKLEVLLKQHAAGAETEAKASAAEEAPGTPPATPAAQLAAAKEAPGPSQIDTVSKAMKGMKPEQAAAVVAHLDRRLAAEVLRRMRPADAGAVMGFLKPEVAADLATEIALRKPMSAGSKKGSTQ